MMKKLLTSLLFGALALTPCLSSKVFAADFPSHPITIVVPFGAGGETDIVARLLADSMSKILKQNVAVQNITGANAQNGISNVLMAKPNGYKLGFAPSAPIAIHPLIRKVPYSIDSFTFIGIPYLSPYHIMVPKSAPWKTFDDMTKDFTSNPDKFFWATYGPGSLPDVAVLSVFNAFGVKNTKSMPFTSDGDIFQALAGNRAHMYASTSALLAKQDVKSLLFLGAERDPAYPDVPTAKELGKDVEISQWGVVFGPKDMPAEIVSILDKAVADACASEEFIAKMKNLGMAIHHIDSKNTAAFILQQNKNFTELFKSLN